MKHTLRSTIYDAIRGDEKSAFQKLGENVQEHENPREKAAETYLSLSPEPAWMDDLPGNRVPACIVVAMVRTSTDAAFVQSPLGPSA